MSNEDKQESAPRRRGKAKRKTQFRWNEHKDEVLVTEVSNLKPFLEEGHKEKEIWKIISESVNIRFGANIDHIGAKNRFKLLLDSFKSNDSKNRYK